MYKVIKQMYLEITTKRASTAYDLTLLFINKHPSNQAASIDGMNNPYLSVKGLFSVENRCLQFLKYVATKHTQVETIL